MPDLGVEMLLLALAGAVVFIVALSAIGSAFFTVETQTVHIVERFGRFARIASPGLNFRMPFGVDRHYEITLAFETFNVVVETKTKDNVFVKLAIRVQYRVPENDARNAYYLLDDPNVQISALVSHVVVSQVPLLGLDEVFERKNETAQAIKEALTQMHQYGYQVTDAFITDIVPDELVKEAMNRINAAQRNQQAASADGEATKIKMVKVAEGEAEAKRLSGVGVAAERLAIATGLKESVSALEAAQGVDTKEAMTTLLLTQYFDALKAIGMSPNSTMVMLPHQPGALQDLVQQITSGMSAAGALKS